MRAVTDTCAALLTYPFGFHGDTGMREYLYARLQLHGGEALVIDDRRPGFSTLLLQAEHYTTARYSNTGRTDTGARFDLALTMPPASSDAVEDRYAQNLQAVIAFELGKNKDLAHVIDATMLAHTAETVTGTSDVSKLYRELAHHELRQGWAIEFYDSRGQRREAVAGIVRSAHQVLDQVALDEGRRLIVVFVAYLGDGVHHVSSNDAAAQKRLLDGMAVRGISATPGLPTVGTRAGAPKVNGVASEAELWVRGRQIVEYRGRPCHLSCRGYSFALREFADGRFVELIRGSGDRDRYLGLKDEVRVLDVAPAHSLDETAFWGPYFADLTKRR